MKFIQIKNNNPHDLQFLIENKSVRTYYSHGRIMHFHSGIKYYLSRFKYSDEKELKLRSIYEDIISSGISGYAGYAREYLTRENS